MNNEYDVIVVGAGCAGPAAAKKAAELGLSVLLLEKSQVPGEKNVSGTCLNGAAILDPDLQYIVECPTERLIKEMRTYHINDDRTTVFHEIPSEGVLLLSVRRDHLDSWHTEEAKKAGAEVKLSTTVVDIIEENDYVKGVITDSGEKYFGKVVIDAAGVNSIVGRKAGLIPKRKGTSMILYITAAVKLGEEVINERFGDCIEYYLSPDIQYKTWPWIFPKKDTVTLGTGGYMDENLINDEFPNVKKYMDNFMNLPIVKKKIEGGEIVSWGVHLEYDETIERRVRNGLILTGEAGGFVIPFLGEGMPEAFFTGIYAAISAAEAIEAGDFSEAKLSERYEQLLGDNFFMQAFRHIAAVNKEAILSKSDEEITRMMQQVIMGGGFISNAIHTKWMKGVEDEDMELIQEAYDFQELIVPYASVDPDFENLIKERGRK
ncbi:MAG: NAD(P)/FAD-dependent oxidoreductase [Candidatus Heimdallarchaeota archaeon]|nr:NAD(P)/FAD-dependent oxidoreductase [Candidatus Heimdallarchaeota archaeon]